jgi:general secretion pathway protein C
MKRYLAIINILLITAAVYFAVKAFYGIAISRFDRIDTPVGSHKQVLSPTSEARQPLSYYDPIIKRNLFNTQAGAHQKSQPVDLETLKPTELNLKLWGTVMGEGTGAYAVIEETKARKQNLYRVGDAIQNATVKMILREKVVLRVEGKDEILEIEKASTAGSKVVGARAEKVGMAKNVILRSMLDDATKNINELMAQVRIRPYFERGKPAGLLLSGIKPNSIFSKMGLRSGDIIKGVDGKDIKSVDEVLELYQTLRSSSSVSLQLKRRGRPLNIDYTIQ